MSFMNSRGITCTMIVLSVLRCDGFAQTPTAADLNALRTQIDAIKADYEQRIQALEMQLQALQTQIQTAPKPEPAAAPTPAQAQTPGAEVPAGAQGAGGPTGTLPVYG